MKITDMPIALIINKNKDGLICEGVEIPLDLIEITVEKDMRTLQARYIFKLESMPTNRSLEQEMGLVHTAYGSLVAGLPMNCRLIVNHEVGRDV